MNRSDAKTRLTTALGGPKLLGPPLFSVGNPARVHQLLTEDERARLSLIASVARFNKGDMLLRAGEPADAVYNVITGVVKSFAVEPDGSKTINGFLFTGDLVGLSDEGKYANSVEAVTAVTTYRLPVSKLESQLRKDAELEFHVICKLCEELRQAQRHAFIISRREAAVRVVLFLHLMEQMQADRGEPTNEIYLPMDRTAIGGFADLSLASVSRAFRKLTLDGVIAVRNRHHVVVRDRKAFDQLAALA
ncbi:Crp/Fnr family transcriptional regulator [Reyranella sp.]|uniref:Crp/Fnr family transcriptional regulator n=1 Tax=Reyranella sp. TaxID=1929291 RepID=UPI00378333BC